MANKIIGVTVGTTSPRPNWAQTNTKKSDYIKNKPEQDLPNVTEADNDKVLQVEDGKWQAKPIYIATDKTLTLENGVLRVNIATEKDRTLPISAASVDVIVGNIDVLLQTI